MNQPVSRRSFLTATSAGLLLAWSPRRLLWAEPPKRRDYDVVVYGGVPCGIAAAITAARAGASVLMIEPTKHVGGLSTSGINTAESEHMLKWTIGGFAVEFYNRLGKHYGSNKPEYYFESHVAEKVYLDMLAEAKVEVLYGRRVTAAKTDGGVIRSITLNDGAEVAGKVFVDASYEGDVMARAGVDYTWGRESRNDFGESIAGFRLDPQKRSARTVDADGKLYPEFSLHWKDIPEEGSGDRKVMNYNYRLSFTRDEKNRVAIPKPSDYRREQFRLLAEWIEERNKAKQKIVLRDVIDLYARRNGRFEVNNKQAAVISLGYFGAQFGYPDGDYATREKIEHIHRQYTLGLFHFLGTEEIVPDAVRSELAGWGLSKDQFADNGNWPYQLYVREARRMRGVYVVRQQDVQDDRRKDDAIGMSSHFIDSHHVQRVALSENQWCNEGRIWRMGWAYQIPYRALTPQPSQCTNLLVPGAASYTHVAYCTLRLESVWMITGHAAGLAAATAAKAGTAVQQVDVPALAKHLEAQGQVIAFAPGQPEKCQELNGPPEF